MLHIADVLSYPLKIFHAKNIHLDDHLVSFEYILNNMQMS